MLDPALSPEENEHWVRFVELLRQAVEQGDEDDMTFAWIVTEHLLKGEFDRVDFCWIRSGCNDMIHNELIIL